MDPKRDRTNSPSTPPPAPRRRFRVERLEERIAPAGHQNPKSKWVGGGGGSGSGGTDCSTSSGFSGSIF